MQETQESHVRSLGQEDPLEEEMATHSSILAWKIPWTEEPGRLQSMASQRVRHDRATEYTHTARMTLFVTGQHNAVVFKFWLQTKQKLKIIMKTVSTTGPIPQKKEKTERKGKKVTYFVYCLQKPPQKDI